MRTQEAVGFIDAEFDELLHATAFCKLNNLRQIMKTLSKELTSAPVSTEPTDATRCDV